MNCCGLHIQQVDVIRCSMGLLIGGLEDARGGDDTGSFTRLCLASSVAFLPAGSGAAESTAATGWEHRTVGKAFDGRDLDGGLQATLLLQKGMCMFAVHVFWIVHVGHNKTVCMQRL